VDWFAEQALDWYDIAGRKDLPWHRERTPYRVWLSEVMLQQTQVTTVIPYFERFTAHFPDVGSLARASLDHVLALWTGLGYYARARNLHAAANRIVTGHGGELPRDLESLLSLPGIGRSTAGAILASAYGIRATILDGNVKRLLARFHAVPGHPGATATAQALWQHAETHTPETRVADYTQAVMDLGALVCRRSRPDCSTCPLAERCAARLVDRVMEFPAPRPKRPMPVRCARMFLLTDPLGRCLLERRPPSGLWGGLWTPLERDLETTLDNVLLELGLRLDDEATPPLQPVSRFRHTFTHFHLDIDAVRARLPSTPVAAADHGRYRWWSPRDNEPLGLAAPTVRLLMEIDETRE